MKSKTRNRANAQIDFTAKDHRWVQEQIERRAYGLWQARGCPERDSLRDWLCAEREVLGQFCLACEQRFSVRSTTRPEREVKATWSKPQTAIPNPWTNIQTYKPDVETTTPATRL
jgi:Protein of unknown function (DUF2934)